jgi:hypothetical protein
MWALSELGRRKCSSDLGRKEILRRLIREKMTTPPNEVEGTLNYNCW